MTDRAAFLGAGRHSAGHTIELVADPANRPAKKLFLALLAVGLQHLLIWSNEKLKLMAFQTFILLLQHSTVHIFWGHEAAYHVMAVEILEGSYRDLAVGRREGAEELEGNVGDRFHQKGLAALERTDVSVLSPVADALHTVNSFAVAPAPDWLDADLRADGALVLLSHLL